MADDQGKGAGKQALAQDDLAARAAEQRERDAAAFAEREYDLARQAAAANADGNGYRLGRGFGRGYYGPPPPQPRLEAGVTDFAPPAPQSVTDTANAPIVHRHQLIDSVIVIGMFGIINNEVLIVVLIVIKVTRYATQVRDLQMVDHAIRIPAIVEGEGIIEVYLTYK